MQVEEHIDHDLEAKNSLPEETADLDARSLGDGSQVSFNCKFKYGSRR